MGNVTDSSTGDTQVILQPVPTPVLLKDQASPSLGGDLNAKQQNILSVGDLETQTINGKVPSILAVQLSTLFDGIAKIVSGTLAPAVEGEDFAGRNHSHDLQSLSGLLSLSQGGLATDLSSFIGLLYIDSGGKVRVAVPGQDYAPVTHTHDGSDLEAPVPTKLGGLGQDLSLFTGVLKLENGVLVKAEEGKDFAIASHTHPELEGPLQALTTQVNNIPPAQIYDDSEVKKQLKDLQNHVSTIKIPDPLPVQVQVTPITSPAITSDAEYLIFSTEPKDTVVKDSTGAVGTVRVTVREGRHLVRASFESTPKFPLTYTFNPLVPPPVLCSIGTTNNSPKTSRGG